MPAPTPSTTLPAALSSIQPTKTQASFLPTFTLHATSTLTVLPLTQYPRVQLVTAAVFDGPGGHLLLQKKGEFNVCETYEKYYHIGEGCSPDSYVGWVDSTSMTVRLDYLPLSFGVHALTSNAYYYASINDTHSLGIKKKDVIVCEIAPKDVTGELMVSFSYKGCNSIDGWIPANTISQLEFNPLQPTLTPTLTPTNTPKP